MPRWGQVGTQMGSKIDFWAVWKSSGGPKVASRVVFSVTPGRPTFPQTFPLTFYWQLELPLGFQNGTKMAKKSIPKSIMFLMFLGMLAGERQKGSWRDPFGSSEGCRRCDARSPAYARSLSNPDRHFGMERRILFLVRKIGRDTRMVSLQETTHTHDGVCICWMLELS